VGVQQLRRHELSAKPRGVRGRTSLGRRV